MLAWLVGALTLLAGPLPESSFPLPDGPETGAREQARRLYQEGRTRYDTGDYDRAIESFRKAYDLTPVPQLIFDIAQAYRLKGDCRKAMTSYHQFLRLAPSSPRAPDADAQLRALTPTCLALTEIRETVPTDSRPRSEARDEPQPAPVSRTSKILGGVLLTAGVGAGVGAAALFAWSTGRYNRWRREDAELAMAPSDAVDLAALVRRQNDNDNLQRSIARVDRLSVGLAAGAAACLLTAALLPWRHPSHPVVAARQGGVEIAWKAPW